MECTVVLVGVAETIDGLMAHHASVSRSLVQVLLPRMRPEELREILSKAEESLSIRFSDEAASLIVNISQGLPALHAFTRLSFCEDLRRPAFGLY